MASGTAMDWSCKELGATYCFTTELRDTGDLDFLLPAEESGAAMDAVLEWASRRPGLQWPGLRASLSRPSSS